MRALTVYAFTNVNLQCCVGAQNVKHTLLFTVSCDIQLLALGLGQNAKRSNCSPGVD
jgi:hypothetical protein